MFGVVLRESQLAGPSVDPLRVQSYRELSSQLRYERKDGRRQNQQGDEFGRLFTIVFRLVGDVSSAAPRSLLRWLR